MKDYIFMHEAKKLAFSSLYPQIIGFKNTESLRRIVYMDNLIFTTYCGLDVLL